MPLVNRISNFISYFRHQIDLIGSLAGDETIPAGASDPEIRVATHKKILYAAVLDSLAGIRYHGEGLGNHDRFVRILCEHTSWPEGELVSAPVLRERLARGSASPLQNHLDERLARYSTDRGNALPIFEFDEPFATLQPLAEPSERRHLESSQHFELFYKYRTFIVHEFREPGYAMEIFADNGDEPLYHSYIGVGARWRLLYPVGFFRARAESATTSLADWFMANSVNPYDRVRDSSDWYDH